MQNNDYRPLNLDAFLALPESPREVTKGIFQKWVRVTPAVAQRLLAANKDYRKRKSAVIKSIAAQAEAGKFAPNGEIAEFSELILPTHGV